MKNGNFLKNGNSKIHITNLVRKTVYTDDGVHQTKQTTEEYYEQNITSDFMCECKTQYGCGNDESENREVEPVSRNEEPICRNDEPVSRSETSVKRNEEQDNRNEKSDNGNEKPVKRNEEQDNDVEPVDEVSRAMTCRQQTMLFVFLFEKMGIDVKSSNKTELAKLIHKFTGRCLKNIYDNFNIDYENSWHVKNLMVVAKAIENVFPDIAGVIENSCKPIE